MPWHYEQHRDTVIDQINARKDTKNQLIASRKHETMEDKLISFGHTNKIFMEGLRGNKKVENIADYMKTPQEFKFYKNDIDNYSSKFDSSIK